MASDTEKFPIKVCIYCIYWIYNNEDWAIRSKCGHTAYQSVKCVCPKCAKKVLKLLKETLSSSEMYDEIYYTLLGSMESPTRMAELLNDWQVRNDAELEQQGWTTD